MSTAANVQPGKEVLEAEVSPEILQQFEILKNALKKNQELAQEFALNNNAEEFQRMDLEIAKVNKLVKQLRSSVRRERLKNHVLSEQVARDDQMAEQVNRRYEMLTKNPQYGRAQSIEYMHTVVTEHEKLLNENEVTIAKVEDMLRNLMDPEKQSENVTEQDLSNHIRRFDEIFGVVATQIYSINEEVEKIKDAFLERQRKIYGRFARNPFEKQRRNEQIDAFQNLKGVDAFPSQHAVLSISEFLPRQAVQPAVGAVNAFGTGAAIGGGSLFGSGFNKPITSTGGSFPLSSTFNQPGVATSAASTFAKPFSLGIGGTSTSTGSGLGGTSIFGAPKTTVPTLGGGSIFGTAPAAATAATTAASAPSFGFGGVTATPTAAAAPTTPAFGFGSNTAASTSGGANLNLTGNVFGAAAATSTPKQPTLGGFGTVSSATPASGSIFGAAAPQQPSAAQNTNFGSTLSSAASGTLFRGSATAAPVAFGTSTPSSTGVFGGTAKSLFGAK